MLIPTRAQDEAIEALALEHGSVCVRLLRTNTGGMQALVTHAGGITLVDEDGRYA
jgi:hypothetical protein